MDYKKNALFLLLRNYYIYASQILYKQTCSLPYCCLDFSKETDINKFRNFSQTDCGILYLYSVNQVSDIYTQECDKTYASMTDILKFMQCRTAHTYWLIRILRSRQNIPIAPT